MASLRQKFKVSWDGQEPVDVTTSARDLLTANVDLEDQVGSTFRTVHNALVRLGHNPPDYEQWVDLVDEFSPGGTVVADLPNPTQPVPSDGEQLLLRASPAPTGDPGSTGPTTDPS